MLYKLRNMVIGGSVLFLIANISATSVSAAQLQSSAPKTSVATESLAISESSKPLASININSADVATLQKIKSMSKRKAQAIVEYRDKNGPFKSLEDLLKVNCRGIHKKWLDKVSKFLTV